MAYLGSPNRSLVSPGQRKGKPLSTTVAERPLFTTDRYAFSSGQLGDFPQFWRRGVYDRLSASAQQRASSGPRKKATPEQHTALIGSAETRARNACGFEQLGTIGRSRRYCFIAPSRYLLSLNNIYGKGGSSSVGWCGRLKHISKGSLRIDWMFTLNTILTPRTICRRPQWPGRSCLWLLLEPKYNNILNFLVCDTVIIVSTTSHNISE